MTARAFASLRGARQAVVHVYNATAPLFRRLVFQKDRKDDTNRRIRRGCAGAVMGCVADSLASPTVSAS